MRNQQKCSYGPSYVQLNFNFQILNIPKVYVMSLKVLNEKKKQNPLGNHMFENFKIRHTRPTANEGENMLCVLLW